MHGIVSSIDTTTSERLEASESIRHTLVGTFAGRYFSGKLDFCGYPSRSQVLTKLSTESRRHPQKERRQTNPPHCASLSFFSGAPVDSVEVGCDTLATYMAPSKAIQKKEQAARKRERKAKQKAAKEERLAREHEDWVAGEPERKRLNEEKAAKDAERRKQIVAKWGSYEIWQQTPRMAGGGNPMVSRYSCKYPFPGAVKSKKSGGYYHPDQFADF